MKGKNEKHQFERHRLMMKRRDFLAVLSVIPAAVEVLPDLGLELRSTVIPMPDSPHEQEVPGALKITARGRNTTLTRMVQEKAPGVKEAIWRALNDRDLGVREIALANLDIIADDSRLSDTLRRHLSTEGVETRWLVARDIATIPAAFTAFSPSELRELANDSDPLIRKSFLAYIVPGPGVVPVARSILLEAVGCQNATTRMAAAESLHRLQIRLPNHLLRSLIEDLASTDDVLGGAASYVLLRLWRPEVEAKLKLALHSDSPMQRVRAADLFRKRKIWFNVTALTWVFHKGPQQAQLYACGTLSRTQTDACVAVLKSASASRYPKVRQAAIYALEDVGTITAFSLLSELTGSHDENVRYRAAIVLGRQRVTAAGRALDELAGHDVSPIVREAARIAAAEVKGQDLANVLVNPTPIVKFVSSPEHLLSDVLETAVSSDGLLEIGNRKQLLVDNFAIESCDAVRKWHSFVKDPRNPVLEQQLPWELQGVNGYCTTVDFDPESQIYVYWYTAYWRTPGFRNNPYGVTEKNRAQLLAYSNDGVHWQRPNLAVMENANLRVNNMVGSADNILRTAGPGQGSQQFASYAVLRKGREFLLGLSFSPDGLARWSKPKGVLAIGGDVVTMARDQVAGGYVGFVKWRAGWWLGKSFSPQYDYSTRALLKTPSTGFRASGPVRGSRPDQLSGGEINVISNADDDRDSSDRIAAAFPGLDFFELGGTHSEIYEVTPFPYEGVYFAIPAVFHVSGRGGANDSGTVGLSLIFSRNPMGNGGWHRAGDGKHLHKVLEKGCWGEWDSTQNYGPSSMVVTNNEIVLYYSGSPEGHEPEGAKSDSTGNRAYRSAIGRATMRLDGMASLHAGEKTSAITTRLLVFQGKHLFVNARCPWGSLTVELVDQKGRVIRGFEARKSIVFRGDSVRHEVRWKSPAEIASVAGRPVRVRFYLRDGDFYSFQFG